MQTWNILNSYFVRRDINMSEQWKEIEGFVGYEVSDQGRVRSFRGDGLDSLRSNPKILKPQLHNGYRQIPLYRDVTLDSTKTFKVARLVATYFKPNHENKPTVNHINGIKTDDRAVNLEWATYSENTKHAYKHGLNYVSEKQKEATSIANRGSKHGNSKLKENDVIKILSLRNNGLTYKEIANKFNISYDTVGNIVRGETWTHINRKAGH